MPFQLDTPVGAELGRITRFSGWHLPAEAAAPVPLRLCLNGRPQAALHGSRREDVAAAFPQTARAAFAGFVGDLYLPAGIAQGERVAVAIETDGPDGKAATLFRQEYRVTAPPAVMKPRPRAYVLADILCHPDTGGPVMLSEHDGLLGQERGIIPVIAGTPHFHPPGALPFVRLTETGRTHSYSKRSLEVIRGARGLVLDFGAGIPSETQLFAQVVHLDAQQARYIDVVNTYRKLPFRSNTFAAVVSQAVFEHIPDPFASAREIWRVLQPGGRVLLDTGSLMPYHGDPSNYFHMTRSGLREIMAGFEIEEIGSQPHQAPSYGWIMQLDAVLPFMSQGTWRERCAALLTELRQDQAGFDESLGVVGREILAAGVFVVARKPK